MAGAGSEARFAGLSLVQLNELLEDEGQLTEMVQKMEEACGRGRGEGCLGGREGWRTWPSCSRTSARQPGEHSPSPLSLFIFLLLLILIAESNQNLRLLVGFAHPPTARSWKAQKSWGGHGRDRGTPVAGNTVPSQGLFSLLVGPLSLLMKPELTSCQLVSC
ncbi:vacuolar protein sorting-associated protein 37B isoform X4 [Homo sapiens]|uniref:vacuolar protein sorting-associated protein 37B isoform X4 n=1 Tax=Homo sapiens TaxID=9606 RepID=UPI0007DC80D2|nr:vacuolar protein sorting-associated protein 37B isoform X4 [Homo sapiens]XP_054229217.1 vacuolar protein sorting-associated protein 37B isoform X4 [Homo sapiens]|eukprot:XP_016875460.1 vacuolar protein sorting-associated protein 37B isoform X5 [Homo sapiens]